MNEAQKQTQTFIADILNMIKYKIITMHKEFEIILRDQPEEIRHRKLHTTFFEFKYEYFTLSAKKFFDLTNLVNFTDNIKKESEKYLQQLREEDPNWKFLNFSQEEDDYEEDDGDMIIYVNFLRLKNREEIILELQKTYLDWLIQFLRDYTKDVNVYNSYTYIEDIFDINIRPNFKPDADFDINHPISKYSLDEITFHDLMKELNGTGTRT